jgi:hypothetical protein
LILRVEELQNHGATRSEALQTAERLCHQEALHRIFLRIEIGAEVEATVGCIKMSLAA